MERYLASWLLLLCTIVAGCGGDDSIVIGAAGPWGESYGATNRRGVELAVEEINAAGGINGRKLEVVMHDDEADGARAAAIANWFVDSSRVVAVVGHVNSGAMVSAARVYDGRLAAIATTATSPDITGISPWVFRVTLSDSATAASLARFTARLGHRRVAILYENDSYGRGLADSFAQSFTGEIISYDPIASGDQNFEPFVTYLRSQAPDAVFLASTDQAGIAFLREAKRQRLRAAFLGGDGWDGVVADSAAAEGAYIATAFSPEDPRPEARAFAARYRQRFGVNPEGNSPFMAYDATHLLATVIERVGTDRRKIRAYLASMNESRAHNGVTGKIYFGDGGDPVGREVTILQVQGGRELPARAR